MWQFLGSNPLPRLWADWFKVVWTSLQLDSATFVAPSLAEEMDTEVVMLYTLGLLEKIVYSFVIGKDCGQAEAGKRKSKCSLKVSGKRRGGEHWTRVPSPLHTHTYALWQACVCTHTHMHTYACTHTHKHTHMHAHMQACMHARARTCTHTHTHTHTYTHTHTHTYTHTHTHTYTHTHTQKNTMKGKG